MPAAALDLAGGHAWVMDPDLALVRAAAGGDEAAFAELVRRHQRRVFNLARALTGSEDEAEDLAQETFIRAFRGLPRFRGDSAFATWLYRIAVNVFRSRRSRKSLWPRLWSGEADRRHVRPADASPAADQESDLVRRDLIDKALAEVPPDLRLAVTLRDIEGLEYREIAEVTGVPIGTVMSRIFRGRQRLRASLAVLMNRPRLSH
ncbi:MAG: sigma-70 family RNA polymerase sigma factor [Acidobacteria bacterium]|nr:sigma-70 family RNA polymerase sigma factor [Acidobacteriota bacterium]